MSLSLHQQRLQEIQDLKRTTGPEKATSGSCTTSSLVSSALFHRISPMVHQLIDFYHRDQPSTVRMVEPLDKETMTGQSMGTTTCLKMVLVNGQDQALLSIKMNIHIKFKLRSSSLMRQSSQSLKEDLDSPVSKKELYTISPIFHFEPGVRSVFEQKANKIIIDNKVESFHSSRQTSVSGRMIKDKVQ